MRWDKSKIHWWISFPSGKQVMAQRQSSDKPKSGLHRTHIYYLHYCFRKHWWNMATYTHTLLKIFSKCILKTSEVGGSAHWLRIMWPVDRRSIIQWIWWRRGEMSHGSTVVVHCVYYTVLGQTRKLPIRPPFKWYMIQGKGIAGRSGSRRTYKSSLLIWLRPLPLHHCRDTWQHFQ